MKLRLVLALYAEGPTDKAFLGNVIPRTAVHMLAKSGQQAIDVLGIDAKKDISIKDGSQRILNAARQLALEHDNQYDEESATYPILIVHCDADAPNNKEALKNRYHPGYQLVQQSGELICKSMIPVIPVRMIESWMLAADHEVLQNVLLTDIKAQELGLMSKVKLVESEPKPKEKLDQIIQKARGSRSRRRYQVRREDLYEPLGRRISLERLNEVPSYKQFVDDFTEALKALRLIG
ncbi:MAG: DUF4276 family protein [Chloroflexota bacterium]|nr:DUF4276 family protein [Chloroflexota bacterium]